MLFQLPGWAYNFVAFTVYIWCQKQDLFINPYHPYWFGLLMLEIIWRGSCSGKLEGSQCKSNLQEREKSWCWQL